MRTQSGNKQTFWRVGNAGDQVVIDVSFTSDCLSFLDQSQKFVKDLEDD